MLNIKSIYIQLSLLLLLNLMLILTPDLIYAASDPFATIQSNIENLYSKIATIVKIVCTIALVIFFVVCLITQEFNKFRFFIMITLLVLIGIAKPLVSFFMAWGGN